jgi:hypothetical protein
VITDGINSNNAGEDDVGYTYLGQSAGVDAEDPNPVTNISSRGGFDAVINFPPDFDPSRYPTAYRPGDTFEHEILHTLGAVQPDVPDSSGGYVSSDGQYVPDGHCTITYDVMCYASTGSSTANGVIDDQGNPIPPHVAVCPPMPGDPYFTVTKTIDCRRDHYFNPSGPILAISGPHRGQPIWNTYDSVFLCPASGTVCADPTTSELG